MICFDTSVLLATHLPGHERHVEALRLYADAAPPTHAIAAHSLAELYAKLTGIQATRVSPKEALRPIDRLSLRFQIISLTGEEVQATLHRCAQEGVTGGTVYDALIVACARKIEAATIYTLNVRHFCRVAPDLADIIREP